MIAVTGVVSPIVIINCIVDSYGILRSDFNKQIRDPNNNFIKINYILNNKKRYDSFLFGSSRVNGINNKNIKPQHVYNMQYSEGVPKEHLDNIKFLIKNGVTMRLVIVGLDDFSYQVDPQKHLSDLMRQPYPDVSGKSWLTFYGEYFIKIKRIAPAIKSYYYYAIKKNRVQHGKIIMHDILDSGRILCKNCDDDIENDPSSHNRDPKFNLPFHYEGDNIEATLNDIREMVQLSRIYHFHLIFFINPIHQTTYLDTDQDMMTRFKQELAQITDYYDFSGLNSITTNNYYYHETSHYREIVGDMMLKRMFGYPNVAVPDDFGVLVTHANVKSHLQLMKKQLIAHRKVQTTAYFIDLYKKEFPC